VETETTKITQVLIDKDLIKVLLVEDDAIDRLLIERVLGGCPQPIEFAADGAGSLSAAVECLSNRKYDVILLDLMLPDSEGLETVRRIKEINSLIPIVVLTRLDDEKTGLSAIKIGAMDYLVKDQVLANVLVRTIRYAIERNRMQQALQEAHDKLEMQVEVRTRKLSKANKLLKKEIIERKKTEDKMKEAMEIKSQFVSTVSHELRTPLTALREGIRLVVQEKTGKLNDEQKEFLSLAKRNVDRLDRLINDVLDFRKLEAGRMSFSFHENDINKIVKDVYDTMAPAIKCKDLDFVLKLEDNLPKVKSDGDKITQVLTNMVSNAIKFTEKGNITITARERENVIQVSVSDTGCGIRKEDLPRVFHEFEQLEQGGDRKTGGAGLGLAISKAIIEQHRGKICVESEYAKGTTFHFVLLIKERRTRERN
jgi:signal transduction histidine kinase